MQWEQWRHRLKEIGFNLADAIAHDNAMQHALRLHWSILITSALASAACGGEQSHTAVVPWATTPVEVRSPTGELVGSGTPDREGCVWIDDEFCVPVEAECSDGGELVVDGRGEVLDALCYPPAATLTPEAVDAEGGEIAQNLNDTVLVLDGLDDGADLSGDVHVDGNNVVIYGEGPGVSQLAGDLSIDGNSSLVRGVAIGGDVSVLKNNAAIAFSSVAGSLTVTANNTRLLGVTVLGDLVISGNNTSLVGVHVAGATTFTGKNTLCEESSAFADADGDGVADESELGAPLDC
jgi:hypothetical protein